MRIAHLCLSNFYIDGRNYQENQLVRQHVDDGHEVLVLASTETQAENGRLTYVEPTEYMGSDGAYVARLAYRRFLPHTVMRKLRMHPGVRQRLEAFRPDAILFHGACGYELVATAEYARRHPSVLFYIDSHEDWNNSARGIASRELLHRLYYGTILRRALPAARKLLCITVETMDFVTGLYGVDRSRVELFPLGGHPVPDGQYWLRRARTRAILGLNDEEIAFIQSGKQTRRKKLIEALQAYSLSATANSRFFIVGILSDCIKGQVERLLVADHRIQFLGWKSADELTDLLCAADVYVQPGTQSVTMQHSLCCRCAVAIDDVPSHRIYDSGIGWLMKSPGDLEHVFAMAASSDLKSMQERAYAQACALLDYKVLAQRVLTI